MPTALTGGLALKPQHFDAALACTASGLWLEVHAENYMVAGGPRRAWLAALRARHPVSLHGVGLSLAADAPPDPAHLERLRQLVQCTDPALVSEHLAWSMWRGTYHPDLLPVLRTTAALVRIADNIQRVQDALRRSIAIENPAHYIRLNDSEWAEIDFLAELARRTGCGLLLDVNNVYVSANNLAYCAQTYIDTVPAQHVREIHLAGHSADPQLGTRLLIDSHDAAICGEVWSLFKRAIARMGPRPTLIERDANVPCFDELLAERDRACTLLDARRTGTRESVCP